MPSGSGFVIAKAHLAALFRHDLQHAPARIRTEQVRAGQQQHGCHHQDEAKPVQQRLPETDALLQQAGQQVAPHRQEEEGPVQARGNGKPAKDRRQVEIAPEAQPVAGQEENHQHDKEGIQPVRVPEADIVGVDARRSQDHQVQQGSLPGAAQAGGHARHNQPGQQQRQHAHQLAQQQQVELCPFGKIRPGTAAPPAAAPAARGHRRGSRSGSPRR